MRRTIISNSINIVSFDIFDTVITRTVAEPRGIFDLLAQRICQWDTILPSRLRQDFTRQRMMAEREARTASIREDISLNEIYTFLSEKFRLPPWACAKLKALEIRTELECTIGVPKAIELIRFARSCGKRVVFVSDMYLPKMMIVRMLRNAEAYKDTDGVYVSGECGFTKGSGRLFDYVLGEEKCSPFQLLHIGDNYNSDFIKPKSLGMSSMYFNEAHLNRYEQIMLLEDKTPPSICCRQALAGTSRAARLSEMGDHDQMRSTIYKLGTNIAGPILFLFSLWVLREAVARDLRRLYFMAREGQIIFEIARKVLSRAGYDLELRYLYGSTQAWGLPLFTDLGEAELALIVHAHPFLTIRMVAQRLGLPAEPLQACLKRAQFTVSHLDARLSNDDTLFLKELLASKVPINRLISECAASAKQALLAYLAQEKLTDSTSCGFVDTGWVDASSQIQLNNILRTSGHSVNIVGLYFGLQSPTNDMSQVSYFFDSASPPVYRDWGKAFISVFEAMCLGEHVNRKGHSYDGCAVVPWPKKSNSSNYMSRDDGLHIFRRGINKYIDSVPRFLYDINPEEYKDTILRIIKLFISKPDILEADALDNFRLRSEQAENGIPALAPPLTIRKILAALMDRTGVKCQSLTFWPEASICRSGLLVRGLIPMPFARPFIKLLSKNRKGNQSPW